jgi:hypothetical protein
LPAGDGNAVKRGDTQFAIFKAMQEMKRKKGVLVKAKGALITERIF